MRAVPKRFEIGMLIFSIAFFAFIYGVLVEKYQIFPYEVIENAYAVAKSITSESTPFYYFDTRHSDGDYHYDGLSAYDGLNLVVSVVADKHLSVNITDMQGAILHKWHVDWFDVWPDETHLPEKDKPKSAPGTHVHGIVLLDNGEIVFNYEHSGLVKLNLCSKIVWRLPYRTHHSVHVDQGGNLWVPAMKNLETAVEGLPNYKPPFVDPLILVVSQEGVVLREISVLDLLRQNGLDGLLYMSTLENFDTEVTGDTLHLNDIETFHGDGTQGFFAEGDVMISLRNIHAVLVFDPKTGRIKYKSVGEFVRQHDPDFIDGNTISVLDNHNIAPWSGGQNSRIVVQSVTDGNTKIYYQGKREQRFYTDIMGKHQWLPNGNLLITESMNGRAFEINKDGDIVWQYVNVIDDKQRGLLEEVQRLPAHYRSIFSEANLAACRG